MTSMRSPIRSTCRAPKSPSTFAITTGAPRRRRPLDAVPSACVKRTSGMVLSRNTIACAAPTEKMLFRGTRIVSTTASSGMPNICPPASTVMTRVIITLKGSVKRTVVPSPGDAARFDVSAEPLHRRAHRVHSDAAARQFGDCRRRRKARCEDQVDDFRVAHGRERFRGNDVALVRHLTNSSHIDAAAVVRDFEHDVLALAERAYADGRDGRFAGGRAHRGILDAVIDRVAQHVHQRLEEHLDDRLVRLGVVSLDHQPGGLAEIRGHFAYQARKALKRDAQRKDAHREHGSLQLADEPFEGGMPVLERRGQRGAFVLRELDRVADRVLGDGELAGQTDQRVDSRSVDAQRLRAGVLAAQARPARPVRRPACPRARPLSLAATARELCAATHSAAVAAMRSASAALAQMAQHVRRHRARRSDDGRAPDARRRRPASSSALRAARVPASIAGDPRTHRCGSVSVATSQRRASSPSAATASLGGTRDQRGDHEIARKRVELVERRPRVARADVDGEQARQRADPRDGILLAEEAIGIRPIANCRLRVRGRGGMGLHAAPAPSFRSVGPRAPRATASAVGSREASDDRGALAADRQSAGASESRRATGPPGRGTSGNCRRPP